MIPPYPATRNTPSKTPPGPPSLPLYTEIVSLPKVFLMKLYTPRLNVKEANEVTMLFTPYSITRIGYLSRGMSARVVQHRREQTDSRVGRRGVQLCNEASLVAGRLDRL